MECISTEVIAVLLDLTTVCKMLYWQFSAGNHWLRNKLRSRKGLRIWNNYKKHTVKQEQRVYNQLLQKSV